MSAAAMNEPDRLPGAPHPRDTRQVFGHEGAERAFIESLQGRMHHAWLLGGPQGIGKASFAYRAARFMLAHVDPLSSARQGRSHQEGLDVDTGQAAMRRLAAGAHADLTVLRRMIRSDGKGVTANIPVDAVRHMLDMFGNTAAAGGWRVCIIDSAEDLERASANALLKALEEPPARCLFLIVSHAPGRLLPTIRSRCRFLNFRPLNEGDLDRAVRAALAAAGRDVPDAATLGRGLRLAEGSVRRALIRCDARTLALIDDVRARLEALPGFDLAKALALGEAVAGRGGEADFAIVLETIQEWLSHYLTTHAAAGASRLAPVAQVWEKLAASAREAEIYNLDRRPLILTMFQDLSAAMREARAA